MILRSLGVEGWRCFAAAVEVGPFTDGLNIIHGPNGIGKSTLMTALARGLFDSHGVGGTDIHTLKPWGRDLNPKVMIEFEHDGTQYQLRKQFLSSPSSKLCRLEEGRYVPLAESRDADERARQLLSGEAPGRGASDLRHWGLAQILWASQGSLAIEQLTGSTRATIESALGAQIAAVGSESLEREIKNAFNQFFTPTGRLRSGATAPAIVGLQTRYEEAESLRVTLLQRLQDFDDASRRIEDLRRETEAAQQDEGQLNERLKGLREQAQAYRDLVGQQKLHQQAVTAAADSYRRQSEQIESIRSLSLALQETTRELQQRRDDLPAVASLVQQCTLAAQAAEQRLADVRQRRTEVNTARQVAKAADRHAKTRAELEHLSGLLQRIEGMQRDLKRVRSTRDEIVAPDKKTLKEITRLARARDDLRIRLDASLITVTVIPTEPRKLDVTRGEQPGPFALHPDQPLSIKGSPEVTFQIPGVGEFRATGPSGDFEQLRQEWESAVSRIREITAGFGSDDVAVLESRRAEADELDRQLSEANFQVETLLAGETFDTLRDRRARASNAWTEILAEYPSWHDSSPDPIDLARLADDLEAAFNRDVEAAEAEFKRSQQALQTATEKRSTEETGLVRLEEQAAARERQLQGLRQDGLDDQARRDKLLQVAMHRDVEIGKLQQVESQIVALGADPTETLKVMEGQLDAVRARTGEATQKLNRESGRLQQITSEAPYSSLATIEEELDDLQQEITRQRVEIDAIRLLHETLEEQRRGVLHSVLHPIRSRANHILQRITGPRFEDVTFDESLLPSGISPRLAEDAVALTQISGGEREQVHFAVRMALADAAFQNDRQLVVLDDVFTYTDTTRLARIATILDEVAQRFQIVLLTCHPERYRGLPNATFHDLEAIAEAAR